MALTFPMNENPAFICPYQIEILPFYLPLKELFIEPFLNLSSEFHKYFF